MKKILAFFIALSMLFAFTACDNGTSNNNSPLVNNPPQSDQLSYETNKDGYIISCVLTIDGETFTYQCKGENYLLIDNTDGNYVISEQVPVSPGIGATVKQIYFYEGTAREFIIDTKEGEDLSHRIGTRIQVFNKSGQIIVDHTPRPSVDNFYFSLSYQPGLKVELLDTSKDALLTGNAQNLGFDEKAIRINEAVFEKVENGIISNGRLTSTTFYDIDTGNVIYSCIYNTDSTYTICIYDRSDYRLVYWEEWTFESHTKRYYNADGSYYEKVSDCYDDEVFSEGEYDANGTLIAPSQD